MRGNMQVEPYRTPEGFLDFPFIYVFDGTALTDGNTYFNLALAQQGDSDFVLRRIVGLDTILDTPANGGKWNYKNASGSYANASQASGIARVPNWPVLPEKFYPFNAQFGFDLFKVLRSNNPGSACGAAPAFNSFIGFQGVKRFPKSRGYNRQVTQYKYKEQRYSYEYALTVATGHWTTNTSGVATPAARQVIPLDNYDFELLGISISASTTPGATGTLQTNDFQVMLYDPNMHQLSNLPLNQGWINRGKPTPAAAPPYQSIFPVPSIVWPAGGNIVFDVTSMLCAADAPKTYNVSFEGIWRIPC